MIEPWYVSVNSTLFYFLLTHTVSFTLFSIFLSCSKIYLVSRHTRLRMRSVQINRSTLCQQISTKQHVTDVTLKSLLRHHCPCSAQTKNVLHVFPLKNKYCSARKMLEMFPDKWQAVRILQWDRRYVSFNSSPFDLTYGSSTMFNAFIAALFEK